MAIVKKIMDLHNGEIEIDSVPGGGTVVRLVIPRAMDAVPVAAERGA
jgi:signal transduction histidine kinase